MADFLQLDKLIQELKDLTEQDEIPWPIFAEMKAARDYRVIQPLIQLFWEYSASHKTIEVVKQILASFGAAALPALIAALESPDMETRYLSAITLGEIADPLAIEPLVLHFGDEERDVRLEAGIALSKIGEKALPSILKAVFDPDATTRYYALVALKHFDGSEVKDAIVKSLSVENKGALMAAAQTAGRPGFVEAVPGLVKLLQVQTDDGLGLKLTKADAATSLGIIGDQTAVDALGLALTNKYEPIAEEAAVALGKIGDVRAIPLLIDALETVESKGVRYAIVGVLDRFGDAAKPDVLTALRSLNPNVRFGAVMALGLIGNTTDLPELELLAETDGGESFSRGKVKTAAGKAVKKIKEKYERAD